MSEKNITPIGGKSEENAPEEKGVSEIKENVSQETTKQPEKPKRQPRKRVPLGRRNVLTAPKRPGFVRRFVNNKGDRVQQFKDAGWNVVGENIEAGDPKAGKASNMGSLVNPSVGGGLRAVLMEVKEDIYEEDRRVAQDEITQVENEIRRNSKGPDANGLEGKIKIS